MRMWYADKKSKEKIKEDIMLFLSKYAPDLSLPRWEAAIDRQINLLGKYPLIELDGIGITQKEIDTIMKLDRRMHKRLAFTLLCIAKFKNMVNEKNNDWASCNDKEIFRMANIQKNVVEQSRLFRELRDAEMLQFSMIVDNLNVRVLYIDKEGEPIRFIDDFRNLGNQMHAIEGEPYLKCEKCGLVVQQNKNETRKYCRNCEKYNPIERKYILCLDCGDEISIDARDMKTIRCKKCQKERDKERKRNWWNNKN